MLNKNCGATKKGVKSTMVKMKMTSQNLIRVNIHQVYSIALSPDDSKRNLIANID